MPSPDTSGYHFKQLPVDDAVAWEQDVAGGTPAWQPVDVDVSRHVRGKTGIRLSFRLVDKRGVGNFGVRWRVSQLQTEGLRLRGNLDELQMWQVSRHGRHDRSATVPCSVHLDDRRDGV